MRIIENPPIHLLDEIQYVLSNDPESGIVDIGSVMEAFYVIAEENGMPLGVATVICEPLELHKLYVAPRYRRQGVGKQLVDYVISMATMNGAEELSIEIAGHSRGFWKRMTAGRRIREYSDDKFEILLG